MSSATDPTPSEDAIPLYSDLSALIAERFPRQRVRAIAEFARAYVRRIPADVLAGLGAEELFGQIVGAFELADSRGEAPFVVRVFNPTTASDGYATAGTVVETNCEDSPFLVDSVREELQARDLEIRLVVHPVIGTERDAEGRILHVLHARDAVIRESVMHFDVSRRLGPEELVELEERLRRILADLQAAVADFELMKVCVAGMIEAARSAVSRYSDEEVEEAQTFLEWLTDGNFTFLGYREYAFADEKLSVVQGAGLGILRDDARSRYATPVPVDEIEPALRERLLGGTLLVVSKTNRFSTVHRRRRMDDITIKRVGAEGSTVALLRLLGLFTTRAYMTPASRIPIIGRKLRQIAVAEDFLEGSHDYKALIELFESFPKDELFAASAEELRKTLVSLLDLQERRNIQLFVRPDIDEGRVAVLVALPRDRFNAELRRRLQELFVRRFGGSSVDYHLSLGESDQARIHFTVYVDGEIPEVSFAELEQEAAELARTWDDRVREQLVALHGEERGGKLAAKHARLLPEYYKSSTPVYLAVLDIEQFERLEAGEPFVVGLKNEQHSDQNQTRLGLYKTGGKVRLSDFLPILEHLGLTVVEEIPTRLEGEEDVYLHDFGVLDSSGSVIDLAECGERVADAISAVWRGDAESDSLNRLVVSSGLTWRQVSVLRAYRKYRQRVSAAFTEEYQNDAFAHNPQLAAKLVRLFELRFDPSRERDLDAEHELSIAILADLAGVRSLDEDRILRACFGVINATLRTNAFRPDRRYLSFKLQSAEVPDMPKPQPLYEIFVCSPEMEGIHLRGGKVARGGIRWSDRREDYRTEILGLMKAQMVKNALIVPVGSKGGFVLRRTPPDREELKREVTEQYSTLIRGMLDLTDNLVAAETVHPPGVRVLDDDDPYLVVAADKGTAKFSDLANSIAADYGFWLDDAFASGGSHGYDHKALGITARGVWESVKRHFRELGLDILRKPFTVVGIGDMSGDVFGNGMLLSERIKLVAAFDHRHVFLDPDPDPAVSFAERGRLFELPSSSWDDYDRTKLSAGGGVWSREEKTISLAPEARRALGVDAEAMTPNELLSSILKAPVDLFWNGGIGTFVKASDETHEDVGDRANNPIRVDGKNVRARVAAEGGNLGFTQRGRIEYANAGGAINADFIDNSAGVDTSDHEVNLKILLGIAEAAGDLTRNRRNTLLKEVEEDVAAHVLYDNYLQAQIISQEAAASQQRIEAYEELVAGLEAEGLLEREMEALPSSEEMAERARAGHGMARPELCVLLAYAKRSLEEAVRLSKLPEDPYLDRDLRRYFPAEIVERFGDLIAQHPLRQHLAATMIANEVVNDLGITWTSRVGLETGAEPAEVARAFYLARDVTDAVGRWADVEALDGQIDPVVQNALMVGVDTLVQDVARWYLLNAPSAPLGETIEATRPLVAELSQVIDRAGPAAWRDAREEIARGFVAQGVEPDLARRHAFQPELAHAPDIIAVAQETGRSLEDVASAFFLAGEQLHLDWLERRLVELPEASRFERWAVQALGDDLMVLRRNAVQRALESADGRPVAAAFAGFLEGRAEAYERLGRLVSSLDGQNESSIAALTVALRQVRGLVS